MILCVISLIFRESLFNNHFVFITDHHGRRYIAWKSRLLLFFSGLFSMLCSMSFLQKFHFGNIHMFITTIMITGNVFCFRPGLCTLSFCYSPLLYPASSWHQDCRINSNQFPFAKAAMEMKGTALFCRVWRILFQARFKIIKSIVLRLLAIWQSTGNYQDFVRQCWLLNCFPFQAMSHRHFVFHLDECLDDWR